MAYSPTAETSSSLEATFVAKLSYEGSSTLLRHKMNVWKGLHIENIQ